MSDFKLAQGVVHEVPGDLKQALMAHPDVLALWQETITPLGRNEWICWTTSVKKQATRDDHVRRAVEEIRGGKRRPCCWAGCMHRNQVSGSKT